MGGVLLQEQVQCLLSVINTPLAGESLVCASDVSGGTNWETL
jgi:hypothetical protein